MADLDDIKDEEFVDWGHNEEFIPEIGTGECAGASMDVVSTIIMDAEEKLYYANEAMYNRAYHDAAYNSYNAMVVAAKALLLSEDHQCNTHINIIKDFDKQFVESGLFDLTGGFENLVLQIKGNQPSYEFVEEYFARAQQFVEHAKAYREAQVAKDTSKQEKKVVADFYKA